MQRPVPSVAPRVLHERMITGHQGYLVDVRSSAEFNDQHAVNAVSIPMEQLDSSTLKSRFGAQIGDSEPLYLICASGIRAEKSARKLAEEGMGNIAYVVGGTDAWSSQALPTVQGNKAMSLTRQSQIVLGPVNTMRIFIDGDHFFARQGALSAMYLPYISESATKSCGKMVPSLWVDPQMNPFGVAPRLFGTTKPHSARLAWPHLRANAVYPHSVNRP